MASNVMPCHSSPETTDAFIQRLPNELFVQIFELSGPTGKEALALKYWLPLMLVCQRWYPVAQEVAFKNSRLCLRPVEMGVKRIRPSPPWIGGCIQSLKLKGWHSLSTWVTAVLPLLRSLGALRSLTLGSGFAYSDQVIFKTFRELPLTHLQVSNFMNAEILPDVANIPTLNSLTVNYWGAPYKIRGDGGRRRRTRGDILRRYISEEELVPRGEYKTSKITSLQFKGPTVDVGLIKRLMELPAQLENVTFNFVLDSHVFHPYKSEEVSEILSPQAASLKTITLLISRGPGAFIPVPDLARFSCLETLILRGGHSVSSFVAGRRKNLSSCSLTHLVIELTPNDIEDWCSSNGSESLSRMRTFLKRVHENFPALKILQLDYFGSLCNPDNDIHRGFEVSDAVAVAEEWGICLKLNPWQKEWGEEPKVSS